MYSDDEFVTFVTEMPAYTELSLDQANTFDIVLEYHTQLTIGTANLRVFIRRARLLS